MPIKINSKADSENELSVFKGQATTLVNQSEKLEISTSEQLEKATDLLARVKKNLKAVTDKKKAITDPMNAALKETRALFKPVEDKLTVARDQLSIGILEYRNVERQRQLEAEAKVHDDLASGTIDEDQAIDALSDANKQQEKTLYGGKGSVTVSTYRDIEITDQYQIPQQYWMLDMTALRRDALGIKSQGIEPIEIPGVKVVEKERI